MCMRATEERCVLAAQQNELKGRVTVLEREVANIRAETQAGFKQGSLRLSGPSRRKYNHFGLRGNQKRSAGLYPLLSAS